MRRFLTRRRALTVLGALIVVFAAFEVGIRLLPPDAVSYEFQSSVNGGPVMTTSGVITDPATVARWRAAMTAHPSRRSLPNLSIAGWQGRNTCAPLGLYTARYRFTWHGLPVEVVSHAPGCGGGGYQVSSGGIPDWNTYLINPLPQP